jgi:DNA-binding NarL/FixJ family response regulator
MSIRVAIVEDDLETRQFTIRLINRYADMECVGGYSTGEDFMDAFEAVSPQVVIMDLDLKRDMNGIDCIRLLKPRFADVEFLIFTITNDAALIFEALSSGATGYLLKDAKPEEIAESIRQVYRNGAPMSESIARLVISSFHHFNNPYFKQLTEREREVVSFMKEGLIYKEIASHLNVDTDTIRKHIYNIYRKLEVNNRTEALRKLYR